MCPRNVMLIQLTAVNTYLARAKWLGQHILCDIPHYLDCRSKRCCVIRWLLLLIVRDRYGIQR